MPLRLSLIKTDSAQADPKPRQYTPADTGNIPRETSSSPTLIQDETMAARAPDVHADLHTVITAWPTLSEGLRTTILRLIQEGEVQQ
jgi:hypothetical protein